MRYLIVSCLCVLGSCSFFKNLNLNGGKELVDINEFKNKNRKEKEVVLKNGLKVLLISDPTVNQSAAAMDVKVGSIDDPRDSEGLAHYLEHMLFMGSKKSA